MSKVIKYTRFLSIRLIPLLEIVSFFSKSKYLKLLYVLRIGKKLDLDAPKSFNEKIQRMKLNYFNQEYFKLVNKYDVRTFLEQIGYKDLLIPLIGKGIYRTLEEIDLDFLKNQDFIAKNTLDSGSNFVYHLDDNVKGQKLLKKKFKKLFKSIDNDYSKKFLERPYDPKFSTKGVIIESLLKQEGNFTYGSDSIVDYKILCFHGVPKVIYLITDRNSKAKCDFFSTDFRLLEVNYELPRKFNKNNAPKKPFFLNEMLKIASDISKKFPFARIDFYFTKQIYFGEITFFPSAGFDAFEPNEFDDYLGKFIDINNIE